MQWSIPVGRIDGETSPVNHWIPGRSGRVFDVRRPHPQPRTFYKWVDEPELVLVRDRLSQSIIPTPQLLNWWPREEGLPAAVELECIPRLAVAEPHYHFVPDAVKWTPGDWLGPGLDELVDELGVIHETYRLGPDGRFADRVQTDMCAFEISVAKIKAVAHLPGGERWASFWHEQAEPARTAFSAAHEASTTWLWNDAKWDHVGRRADDSIVFLEWSALRGPGGSDLFLLLFLEQGRRDALIERYANRAGIDVAEVCRGLLRSCYLHGPGLACLATRGVAEGASSPLDLAAWESEAQTVVKVIEKFGG